MIILLNSPKFLATIDYSTIEGLEPEHRAATEHRAPKDRATDSRQQTADSRQQTSEQGARSREDNAGSTEIERTEQTEQTAGAGSTERHPRCQKSTSSC